MDAAYLYLFHLHPSPRLVLNRQPEGESIVFPRVGVAESDITLIRSLAQLKVSERQSDMIAHRREEIESKYFNWLSSIFSCICSHSIQVS